MNGRGTWTPGSTGPWAERIGLNPTTAGVLTHLFGKSERLGNWYLSVLPRYWPGTALMKERPEMSAFKKRIATVAIGLALAFGVAACDDDNGTTTTVPGSTDTTDPVGS